MKKYETLFQIGEVAALLNISRKMILNYENHNLIKPTLIDQQSGYRYFDSYTIARIQIILDLRKANMSLSDIYKYFNGTLSTETQIEVLKAQISAAQAAIEKLEVRNSNASPIIKEIMLPRRCCICKDFQAKDVEDAIIDVVNCYYDCLRRHLTFADNSYHFCEFSRNLFDDDFYELTNISMKICICIDEMNAPEDAVIYPESKALSISFCGEYYNSITAYEVIKKYIKDNGYTVAGYPQEIYLEGNIDNSSDKNIIWIIIPIE